MQIPKVEIKYAPRHKEDAKPYLARVFFENGDYHAAEAATPSEALLLAAAHWHSRSQP